MNYIVEQKKNERNDQIKSGIITILVALLVLLALYFYHFTRIIPKTEETISTMLINFGEQQKGDQTEEPKTQEPSTTTAVEPTPISEPTPPVVAPQPEKQPEPVKEKTITGNNKKAPAPKVEKTEKVEKVEKTAKKEKTENKNSVKTETKKQETKKASETPKAKSNTKTEKPSPQKGDTKANDAIGNLLKGRGKANASQGNNQNSTGNSGDPLGGDSNGDSKIGTDRKLIAFIPGTMGRSGSQPNHSCTASGTITIAYTVDKAGNVVSARRSGGVSDACVVSTSVAWVKQYVKAEKANTTSTGTYRITF